MIETPLIIDNSEQKLACRIGVVGVVILVIYSIVYTVIRVLLWDSSELVIIISRISYYTFPFTFTAGIFVVVGFVGVFALNGKGPIGLIFVVTYFTTYYLSFYIPYYFPFDVLIAYNLYSPFFIGIIYGFTLLTIRERVQNRNLFLALVFLYLAGHAIASIVFYLIFGSISITVTSQLDTILASLPSLTLSVVRFILLILFFISESLRD